jgi:hypothetical protein
MHRLGLSEAPRIAQTELAAANRCGRSKLRASLALTLLTLACSVPREQSVLDEFFVASSLRDITALARISLVVLEPRDAGTVGRFEIRGLSGIERAPLRADDPVVERSLLALHDGVALQGDEGTRAPSGEIETEEVTLVTTLWAPDGAKANATLVATLRRARVKGPQGTLVGRWIVTGVRGAAVASVLPPALPGAAPLPR